MKIIITESQKESLDYYRLSNCVKRRMDLDGIDDIVDEAMREFVSVRNTIESFIDTTINYTYDQLDIEYGIEECWGIDEDIFWDEFSAPIKRFISSRYEAKLKEYFENHYN
jgi:hypothetical protein